MTWPWKISIAFKVILMDHMASVSKCLGCFTAYYLYDLVRSQKPISETDNMQYTCINVYIIFT